MTHNNFACNVTARNQQTNCNLRKVTSPAYVIETNCRIRNKNTLTKTLAVSCGLAKLRELHCMRLETRLRPNIYPIAGQRFHLSEFLEPCMDIKSSA